MKRKRYHVMIIREDGKQVHNRVLEWFQVRRHLTFLGSAAGLLVACGVSAVMMAGWTGSLLHRNQQLSKRDVQLQASLAVLTKTLDEAQTRLSKSQEQLSSMEELARQQNLVLPKTAGMGGPSPHPVAAPALPSAEVGTLASGIADFKQRADLIYKETQGVGNVLKPHLDELAHTPNLWPVKGFITSGFGRRVDPIEEGTEYHEGVDIAAPYGSPVQAPAEGLVIWCGWKQGYGNCVEISHGGGLVTRYAHLSKILVKPGMNVKRWQKIGLVGTSGRSTGPHLHYEVRRHDQPVNPQRYLHF